MDKGTSLSLISQPDCPAVLIAAVHKPSDFLQSASLRNISAIPLSGFRLGWLITFSSRRSELRLGAPVNLAEPIEPSNTCSVPAQGISSDDVSHGAILVSFFVAGVFLVGEKPWEADLDEIKKKVRPVARYLEYRSLQ
jgi:hypothetical protein